MAEPSKKPNLAVRTALKAYKPSLRERAQIGMEGLYNVFDITGCEGWYATGRGVFVEGTDEEVPRLKLVETTVPPYKRGR